MSKPIEEGCKAIIIQHDVADNVFKSVTVGKFIGKPETQIIPHPLGIQILEAIHSDYWEIDIILKSNIDGLIIDCARTCEMKRIDDFVEDTEHEEVTEEE